MNILLIDDHTLFRTGIATMLENLEPKTVIQGFATCELAVNSVSNADEISLVLLDYHIPGTSAANNMGVVRTAFPNAKLVLLSGEEKAEIIIEAIDLGASGFIPKTSEPLVLIAALKLVISGGVYLPELVLRAQPPSVRNAAKDTSSLTRLTDRQQEVLFHAVDGKSNKNIAREMGLSEGTIKAHLSSAYRALGVQTRSEAVIIASQMKDRQNGQ